MNERTKELKNVRTQERKNHRTEGPRFSSSVLQFFSSRGFTLVELMLSASILATGMVLVARGLLTASSTLQTVENRITAYMFLEERLMELQQQAMEEGGLGITHDAGSTEFGARPVSWTLDIEPVSLKTAGAPADPEAVPEPESTGTIVGLTPEEAADALNQAAEQGDVPEVSFAQVKLRAAWQEAHRQQDVVLMTFLGYKAPPAEENDERT